VIYPPLFLTESKVRAAFTSGPILSQQIQFVTQQPTKRSSFLLPAKVAEKKNVAERAKGAGTNNLQTN